MAAADMTTVVRHLRTVLTPEGEAGLSDGQLLTAFIEHRDEGAFTGLLRRHGAMVWGVCRRLLSNHHDAEDAFQATFLVLARKAGSVVPRELVGNWLYGVAYQTAVKARALAARTRARERQGTEMSVAQPDVDDRWRELQPLLDEELAGLPDKYRVPIVLCDLEGKTRKEAARQLGVPEGTVAGRLARARALLAGRLSRRGVALTCAALGAALSQNAASAGVPPSLVSSTIQCAGLFAAGQATGVVAPPVAALAEGVLKSMLLCKLKVAVAVVFFLAALGAGGVLYGTHASAASGSPEGALPQFAAEGNDARAPAPAQDRVEDAVNRDKQLLQGKWAAARGGEYRGKQDTEENIKLACHRLVIEGDEFKWYTALQAEPMMQGKFTVDPSKKPRAMDLTFERDGKTVIGKCIYEFDGDTLKLCYADGARPTEFKTSDTNPDLRLYVWKREK